MKKTLPALVVACLFLVFHLQAQTTRTAGTHTALTSAIFSSADGDIISITNDIVLTSEIAIAKTLTINGNGYAIAVEVTGLDESGKFNSSPSDFRVFVLSGSGKTVTINNLSISGGYISDGSGGAITVAAGHTLKINNSTISNSRAGSAGGGGIDNNGGTVYLTGCEIMRNAGNYGGGFLNRGSGKMFIERSTFSENRSTIAAGGGGAGENNGASFLYMNNVTLSNNKSTEIGGGINNVNSTIYAFNSSFTGNVAYGDFKGGAIGNNGGTVYAVNCLFAYNYHRATGTTASPATYVLDDMEAHAAPGNIHLYYCIYHAPLTSSGVDYSAGHNINYTGNDDGSNNTIFSGGAYTRITDGTGLEIGNGMVYQPFLYKEGAGITPTLKTGSFILDNANLGAKTGFTSNSGVPIIGYYDRLAGSPAWVNMVGSPAASHVVTTDQIGTIRTDPPSVGAIQSIVDGLYMLKINYAADGSVSGGTVYGDVYASGTSVTLTALPNNGREFVRWDYVAGGTGTASTDNPYTITVDRDITLVPVFQNAPPGSYSITYVGNGNTSGSAPASGSYTDPATIAAKGIMKRSGYIFDGWNTRANGSGTPYAENDNYNSGTNLALYAQWKQNFWWGTTSADYATASNWGAGEVPASGEDIVFAEDAVNDLILDQDREAGNIQFSGAPYKLVLGSFNLNVTGVSNNNSTSYIQTNDAGQLCISISDGATVLFPVGNSAYNPVSVENNTGAADVFCARVLDELYQNGLDGDPVTVGRVKRTWDISKDNDNAGAGVNFVFNWNNGETENLSEPALYHFGSSWLEQTSGTSGSTSNSFTYNGYTGTFSPFGIAEANATLPVAWLSFTVQKQNEHALLTWSTATETNNNYFVAEHSVNGINWETIGVVNGAVNSNTTRTYQYSHTNPAAGKNYYRVRQVDQDGRSSYSSIQTLQFEQKAGLTVYPNPVVSGVLNVWAQRPGVLRIYTNNGQLILNKRLASPGKYSFNLHAKAKGIYRLVFDSEMIPIVIQ